MLEKTIHQFKSLYEFYDKDSIDDFLKDVDRYCRLEKKILEKRSNGILKQEYYEKLREHRHTERINEMYNYTLEINKNKDIREMVYVPLKATDILRQIYDIYK